MACKKLTTVQIYTGLVTKLSECYRKNTKDCETGHRIANVPDMCVPMYKVIKDVSTLSITTYFSLYIAVNENLTIF